jgi:hypothetical protein
LIEKSNRFLVLILLSFSPGWGKGGTPMDDAKRRLILFVLFLSTSLAIFFAFLTLTASIS